MLVKKVALLAAVVLGAIIGSAATAETGITDNEILLGTAHVLSGQSAAAGRETDVGINTYIKEVNAKGGINGRKIKVITCDDRYEPDGAIACFNSLKQQDVFAISGIYGSVCSARYVPMAMNNRLPIIGFYNGTFFLTDPPKRYVFNTRCSYHDEMRDAIDHLWKRGFRKFAVIYQNDAYGADCLEGVKLALKAHNAEVAAAASYTRNKTDVKDAVNDVKKADPEVVFLGAVYKPSAEIVRLAHDIGWKPQFFLNTGSSVDLFIADAGEAAEGIIYTEAAPLPTGTDLPLLKTFQKSLKQYYPSEKPSYVNFRGYMDAIAVVEGLRRAGKGLTREGFVDALEHIKSIDVGLGKGMELAYTPADHLGFHKVFFGTIKHAETVPFEAWNTLTPKH
jgi:branched-chain amino acid transport system substrate-binding protein